MLQDRVGEAARSGLGSRVYGVGTSTLIETNEGCELQPELATPRDAFNKVGRVAHSLQRSFHAARLVGVAATSIKSHTSHWGRSLPAAKTGPAIELFEPLCKNCARADETVMSLRRGNELINTVEYLDTTPRPANSATETSL